MSNKISLIYTTLVDPASGNLLPLNWQGNSVETVNPETGKTTMACLQFGKYYREKLNECRARGIMQKCFKSEKEEKETEK